MLSAMGLPELGTIVKVPVSTPAVGLATTIRPTAGPPAPAGSAGQNHVDESDPGGAVAGDAGAAGAPISRSPISPAASSATSTSSDTPRTRAARTGASPTGAAASPRSP